MKFFQIEKKIVVLSVIYFMLAQSSMTSRATADALLLKYFDESSIPLMVMAAAGLSVMLAMLTTYLCGRFQAYGAMKLTIGGMIIGMTAVVGAFSTLSGKVTATIAYMVCEVVVVMPMVLFWGMAMGVLNPKESKKWFGLIGAAGTCGCILAGYTVSLASRSHLVNELTLGLVVVLLVVVLVILLARADNFIIRDVKPENMPMAPAGILRRIALLISSRQSILMTWLVVFSAMVMCLIDINFKFLVRQDYQAELHLFFGEFYSYTSIAQLLLQLFIVRTILTKGGVFAAITTLPIMLLLAAVAALVLDRADAVYASKFITQVFFFTIEYVGLQMLFLAVKKQVRGQMNSAIDGLTRPATIAVISLLITYTLFFWQENIVLRLNSVVILLCLLWLFVAWLNYREYLTSLSGMLNSRVIDFDREVNVLTDSKFDSQLRDSLRGSNEADALFIADLVLGMGRPDWAPEFREMLTKSGEDLKSRAARYLSEYGTAEDRSKLLLVAQASSLALRLETIQLLGAHCKKEELEILEPLLADENGNIRCAAAAALLHAKDDDVRDKAQTLFRYCLESEEDAIRLQATECLVLDRLEDAESILSNLLTDSNDSIKRAAVKTLDSKTLPALCEKLDASLRNESLRPAISAKLEAIGKTAFDLFEERLSALNYEDDPERYRSLLSVLIEFNRLSRSPRVETFIDKVKEETHRTLLSMEYYSGLSEARRSRRFKNYVRKELDKHLEKAEFHHEQLGKLQDNESFDALRMSLEYHAKLRLKAISMLLSLLDPSLDYRKLLDLAATGGANVEAEATEVVKGVVGATWSERILSLVKPPAGTPVTAKRMLGSLRNNDSRWILAGALHSFTEDDFHDCRSFVTSCLQHEDGMVRETALSVFLAFERKDEEIRRQCEQSAEDACPGVVLLAKQRLSPA